MSKYRTQAAGDTQEPTACALQAINIASGPYRLVALIPASQFGKVAPPSRRVATRKESFTLVQATPIVHDSEVSSDHHWILPRPYVDWVQAYLPYIVRLHDICLIASVQVPRAKYGSQPLLYAVMGGQDIAMIYMVYLKFGSPSRTFSPRSALRFSLRKYTVLTQIRIAIMILQTKQA